jgi:hypothetical protein
MTIDLVDDTPEYIKRLREEIASIGEVEPIKYSSSLGSIADWFPNSEPIEIKLESQCQEK